MNDEQLSDVAAPIRTLEPAELAWISVVPCALATVAAIILLGPTIGHAFLGPGSERFWPSAETVPEPVEHARYVIAMLGAPLLAVAVLASSRRSIRLPPLATRVAIKTTRLALFAFLVVCMLALNEVIFSSYRPPSRPNPIFHVLALACAAALPLMLLGSLRIRRVAAFAAWLGRDTRPRRWIWLAVAIVLTATWLLAAVNFESTIGAAQANNLIPWDMSETFAVLDGRTPFVNFHAQYAQLWPYLAAAIMAAVGNTTIGSWTIVMTAISGVAVLGIYAVFRRIVGSPLLALVLYLPYLAMGFFMIGGSPENRFTTAGIFSLWPLRYAGPYLLAWLTARHVDRATPRRAWLLMLAAGLVALNNAEFGIAAALATLTALVCSRPPTSWRATARVAGTAIVGTLAAAALVSLLTIIRSGELPRFGLLFEFSRLYGIGGWVLEPMAPIGLHIAMYVTFVAAIVVAVVRAVHRDGDRLLTSMLGWSGVFGLITGGYYAGRSDQLNLIALFSPWTFALMLLAIVVSRGLAAREWRRPTLPELAVLFGFGLAATSVAQIPTPWSQVTRLRQQAEPLFEQVEARTFVAKATMPGEKVAILMPLSHRIAYDLGVTNVAPYASIESMPTKEQLSTTIDSMRREHAHKLFFDTYSLTAKQIDVLRRAGFSARSKPEARIAEWTDR